jgi:hypothetical protein
MPIVINTLRGVKINTGLRRHSQVLSRPARPFQLTVKARHTRKYFSLLGSIFILENFFDPLLVVSDRFLFSSTSSIPKTSCACERDEPIITFVLSDNRGEESFFFLGWDARLIDESSRAEGKVKLFGHAMNLQTEMHFVVSTSLLAFHSCAFHKTDAESY